MASVSLEDLGITTTTTHSETNSYPISFLYEYFRKDKDWVPPDFQRNACRWDEKKKYELIDSILRQQKIQPLTIVANEKGPKCSLIDGLQRLTTICDFLENKFPVPLGKDSTLVFYSEIPENFLGKNAFVLNESLRKIFRGTCITVNKYFYFDYQEQLLLFKRIQNQAPMNPSEYINTQAYMEISNNPYLYVVKIADKLRNASWFNPVIKIKMETRQEKTKYNVLVATLLLNIIYTNRDLLGKSKSLLKSTSLSSHHYKDLENVMFQKLQDLYGVEGEKLVEDLHKLCLRLMDKKRSFSTAEFIKLVSMCWHDDIDFEKALLEFRTFKDVLDENQEQKYIELNKLERCVKLKDLKLWQGEAKKVYKMEVNRLYEILNIKSNLLSKNFEEAKEKIINYISEGLLPVEYDEDV